MQLRLEAAAVSGCGRPTVGIPSLLFLVGLAQQRKVQHFPNCSYPKSARHWILVCVRKELKQLYQCYCKSHTLAADPELFMHPGFLYSHWETWVCKDCKAGFTGSTGWPENQDFTSSPNS